MADARCAAVKADGTVSVRGRVISSVGGNYGVQIPGRVITCKARGLFRLKNISPCTGDYVGVSFDGEGTFADGSADVSAVIAEIEPRKNALVRPPLANLDAAVIVVSSCEPKPNALIIDKLTVILENKGIQPVIAFTKTDKSEAALFDLYQKAGFICFLINNGGHKVLDEISDLRDYLSDKTAALIGNTGVGKTSLLNRLIPDLNRPTAEISRKLGRGKHTTRTVELHRLVKSGGGSGYVADTPGFSTVEGRFYGDIPSGEIALYFREFAPYLGKCRFTGCTHTGEEGCAVGQAHADGLISPSRYINYAVIYRESKKAEAEY